MKLGYTNTPLKLKIIEIPTDPNEELENWVEDIDQDLQDIEDESEEMFELEMDKYRARLKRWTNKNKRRDQGTEESEVQGSATKRPKAPHKPSLRDCRKVIEKRYKEIRRRPGEPHIVLELTSSASVTPLKQLPDG